MGNNTGSGTTNVTRNSQANQSNPAQSTNTASEAPKSKPQQPEEDDVDEQVNSTQAQQNGDNGLETLNEDEEQDLGFEMNKKMTVNDFTFLKVVMQVKRNDDGKIYAMKVLKKKALVKRKQVQHTQTEVRAQKEGQIFFVVQFFFKKKGDNF
ncbi:protein kinase 3 [Reticulomyxa filosa]|uniref:Protein kinase 3 n=1 Tax=Reticulomyxa filosa TaxID=46433 RepID=X6MU08_RETFI|nr:protein kinase 3 [Reticulomyxa filosa]|eukprot:ETO16610.1 protein kinase 3 [Reticulomyxa filosa]